MPLKGVQNWVNGWVNVNNNHVVFHEDDSSRHMQSSERSDSQRVSFGGQGSSEARMIGGGHGMMPVMGDGRAILDNRRGDNGVMYGLRPIDRGEYSQNGTPTPPSKSKGSTAVTSTGTGTMTKSSQEPRQQQQQSGGLTTSAKNSYKKNNKKMKLKKTNSQSDLLKEKFAKREQKSDTTSIAGDSVGVIDTIAGLTQHLNRGYETTRRSSNSGSTTSTLMRDNKIHQTPVREVQNVGLGSNMNGSPPFRTTGQYVNELAFANQHRSSQIGSTTDDSSSRSLNRSQMKSTTGSNSSARSSSASKGPQHNYNYPGVNGPKHNIPTSMIGSAIHDQGFAPHQQHQPHQPQMHRNKQKMQHENSNNKTNNNVPEDICLHCKESDNKIAALESDLEYLRLVALKSEFICVECDNTNQTLPRNSSSASLASVKTSKSNRSTGRVSVTSGKHSITSGMYSSATGTSKRKDKKGRQVFADGMNHKLSEPVALAESSQRLGDITARYKRQIENMTRDTARWQNDMHLKLSKLAMMCKDLNDESAKRKEQSDAAKNELNRVRSERNSKSSELDILRARVALYEKQELENTEVRKLLRENENDTLDMVNADILQRDNLIQDLTTRLDEALTTLDEERLQYKQRRQVIFPKDTS